MEPDGRDVAEKIENIGPWQERVLLILVLVEQEALKTGSQKSCSIETPEKIDRKIDR